MIDRPIDIRPSRWFGWFLIGLAFVVVLLMIGGVIGGAVWFVLQEAP